MAANYQPYLFNQNFNQPINHQLGNNPNMINSQSMPVTQNTYQTQSLFPQPSGSLYLLNTASEIGNIPTGTDLSLGLCLPENVMYLKTLQNGSPVLVGYRLIPLVDTGTNQAATQQKQNESDKTDIQSLLDSYEKRLESLENSLNSMKKEGGKFEWQI